MRAVVSLGRAWWPALCVSLLYFCTPPAQAQQELGGTFREETVRDAILGRLETTEGERELFDFNEDGRLDSADLVTLLRTLGAVPMAGFERNASIAAEGDETFLVRIVFTREFQGVLNYRIVTADSSASIPEDAEAALGATEGTVSVNGRSAEIPFRIGDDLEIELMENLVIEILPGEGYTVGAPNLHQIAIDDNDGIWVGQLRQGDAQFGIEVEIKTDGATTEMRLLGDDMGVVPPSTPPEAGWPADVDSVVFGDDAFSAVFSNIVVPADQSARLRTDFVRRLALSAAPSAPDTPDPVVFDPQFGFEGEYVETLTPVLPEFEHLERVRRGNFVLSKIAGPTAVPPPALEASPE